MLGRLMPILTSNILQNQSIKAVREKARLLALLTFGNQLLENTYLLNDQLTP